MHKSLLLSFALIFVPCFVSAQQPKPDQQLGAQIVALYLQALTNQSTKTRNLSMHVVMDASLPGSDKVANMKATRYVAADGEITYSERVLEGDNTVKKDVIARYISAEQEAATKPGLKIDDTNYKFKYYGLFGEGDWKLHLFELSARRKIPGLFNGWLWIEDVTKLPVREQGIFVKNPSLWLKKVAFVRDYLIKEGVAYSYRIDSSVDVRVVGRAELKIEYSKHTAGQPTVAGDRR